MVSPIKPFLREDLIVERSINQPDKCGVYIMLINVSKDCICSPRGMNIVYGEVVDDWDIRAITDVPPEKLHNVSPTPTHQTNIIDFSDTPRRNKKTEIPQCERETIHSEFKPSNGNYDALKRTKN